MNKEPNIEHINFELANLKLPIIIIIGPPGAGKTIVGAELAKSLNWDFYDTDALIEKATSKKITEIFSQSESLFRQLEESLVNKISSIFYKNKSSNKSEIGTVISCGGGLPVPPQNFANLAQLGEIICLQAPASVLAERVGQTGHRPLLNSSSESQISRLEKLLYERKEVYAQAPNQIDTTNKSVEEVVKTIRDLLKL